MGQKQKKEKIEGAAGLDRITREYREKWNQITAPRWKTGVRGVDIRNAQPPFGARYGLKSLNCIRYNES